MSWVKRVVMSAVCFLFLGFASFSNAVTVSIPNTEIASGTTTVEIPINVDNATGIAGFQFSVTFNNAILQATGSKVGSLTSGWTIIPNTTVSGQISVAGFDPTLTGLSSGSGSLCILQFNVVGEAGKTTDLVFTKCILTDVGSATISSTFTNGVFHITGYKLTVNITGSGRVNQTPGNSIPYGDYVAGTVVTLIATPDEGYKFDKWTGPVDDPNLSTTTITMDADKTITANFVPIPRYKITININPSTVGNPVELITKDPAEPSNGYLEGTEVKLTAIPLVTVVDKKYRFVNWTQGGTVLGTTPTLEITMDANKTITANYEEVHEPWVSVDTTAIVFKSTDANGTTATFTITNTGEDGLMWSLTKENLEWIDISPENGGPIDTGDSVIITLTRSGGEQGDSGTIKIHNDSIVDGNPVEQDDVEVVVRINKAPSVEIIYPLDEGVAVETFLTLKAKFFSEGMTGEKGAAIESSEDKIVESTWEIYSGAMPEAKNGPTPIYRKVLKQDIPDGKEFALEVPWALFNHVVFARQIEENEYWWKVSCKDTSGEEGAGDAHFVVVQDETTANQQFNLITDEIDEEEIVNKFNTELPDVTVFQHAFKDAVNSETVVAGVDVGNLQVRSIDPAKIPGSNALKIKYAFDIRVEGIEEGGTTIVSIFIPGSYTNGTFYKYNPVEQIWTLYKYAEVGTVVVDWKTYTQIDVTLVDGGEGDFDGVENGVIVDPIGFAPATTGIKSVSGGGGGCFIATAAYGSYFERHVWILRQFRDKYLLTNTVGSAFVRWYYKHSPKYASIIAQNETLRTITRIALSPLYLFALVCLKGLLFPILLLLGSGILLFIFRKRVKGIKFFLVLLFVFSLFFVNSSYAADTNLFKISPGEKYTIVNPTRDLVEKGKFQIDLIYSYTGSTLEGVVGGVNRDLIEDQSIMQVGFTYGVNDKVNVSLLVPYLIDQSVLAGQNLITEDSGIGDIYLSSKIKLFDGGQECFGIIVIPFVGFDTGEKDAGFGADSPVFGFKVAVDKHITEKMLLSLNLGYAHQDEERLGQVEIEDTLLFGTSLTYFLPKGYITGEIYGRSDDGFFNYDAAYPIEGILSYGHSFGNFDFIIGGGGAITEGYGTADYRIFTGIKFGI